ncbi:MAG: DoxX family membrane protein [Chloroflexia bacterium]|nr:DoxX family membrane protein [Chloroflexia bacterium]
MQFFVMLVVVGFIAWFLPARIGGRSLRRAMRHALGIAFIVTGVSHFVMPGSFADYFPSWAPFVETIVAVSGVVEIIGGLALLTGWRSSQIGIALAGYLLMIFLANVYAAVSGAGAGLPGLIDTPWYPWVRLPFQALFIWWALYSTRPEVSGRALRERLGVVPTFPFFRPDSGGDDLRAA